MRHRGLARRTLSTLISPLINPIDAPWTKVAGIYRRICLLRANGKDTEADRVAAGEFADARSAAEQETGTVNSSETQALVQSLLDAEETRVAEALLFAEVLAPLIAERIRPALVIEPVASRAPFPSDRETHHPAPRPRDQPVPSIADLIDGMLGQERGPTRPPA